MHDDYLVKITEEIEEAHCRVLGEDLIQSELLIKLEAEHDKFMAGLPRKIDISDTNVMREILLWNDMLDMLNAHVIDTRAVRRLLAMETPLEYLVNAYKDGVDPCREYDDVKTAIDRIARELRTMPNGG